MQNKGLKFQPVITIHIEPGDKHALQLQAGKRGMQLATYCRMVLLASVSEAK